MKAKTYGKASYIVITYYTNANGITCANYDEWSKLKYAKECYDRRFSKIGERYFGVDWEGVISSVFLMKGHLCEVK